MMRIIAFEWSDSIQLDCMDLQQESGMLVLPQNEMAPA